MIDGTYGINTTHLTLPTIDIYSDHFYPLNVTKLTEGITQVSQANKVYLAGEYDWTGLQPANKTAGVSSLAQFYAAIEQQGAKKEPVIMGDLFWSLFMHDVPNCNVCPYQPHVLNWFPTSHPLPVEVRLRPLSSRRDRKGAPRFD